MQKVESGIPVNLTQATSGGIVSNAAGTLLGFYVNNTNAGTVIVRDGTTATSTALSGTITPAIGWREFPAYCRTGCFLELGGTGCDVTAVFAAG